MKCQRLSVVTVPWQAESIPQINLLYSTVKQVISEMERCCALIPHALCYGEHFYHGKCFKLEAGDNHVKFQWDLLTTLIDIVPETPQAIHVPVEANCVHCGKRCATQCAACRQNLHVRCFYEPIMLWATHCCLRLRLGIHKMRAIGGPGVTTCCLRIRLRLQDLVQVT